MEIHTHTHTMEFYSTIMNKIMSFIGKWIEPEASKLKEIRLKKLNALFFFLIGGKHQEITTKWKVGCLGGGR